MASTTADTATTAALSLRELGRRAAAESRAQQGLDTPTTDITQLRQLARILDHDVPGDVRTAPRRRRTVPAARSRGTSGRAK